MKPIHVLIAACVALGSAAHADVTKKDRDFMVRAAAGGLYEVEAGRLAESKASSAELKSFGAMLIKDHSTANEELKALAAAKGVDLPTALPADKQKRLDKVSSAKNFDKEFIDEVGVSDHKKDISLFEKASKDADDADVKAFATKTLPTLRAHREHAEGLKQAHKKQ